MLEISRLNAWFPAPYTGQSGSQDTQVLNDVSLTVEAGKTVAIVGESGSGKSLTALSILRLPEENTAIRTSGSIVYEGRELMDIPLESMRSIRGNQIAMIFQEPMTSLNPVFSIGSQLIEPLILHRGLNDYQAKIQAAELLEKCGLDNPSARLSAYPHQLSGGQRQRVMIAMALASSPKLLIADEPTTALDVTTQVQILELIEQLQAEYQMALLLITHDLTMVRTVADHIHIMKDGHIVENGKTADIFDNPSSPYTKILMAAYPENEPRRQPTTQPILVISDLSCSFKMGGGLKSLLKREHHLFKAVDSVRLVIRRGSTCGIVGESGSGKTTLGLALIKLLESSGKILFNDEDIQLKSARELRPYRSRIQIVFQDPFSSLSPRLTVGEIVEEGLRVHHKKLPKNDREELVYQALEEVGLSTDSIWRYPHEFSGGQRQRIAIARALILKPEIIILDEPTSALDVTIQKQVIELLLEIQKKHDITYIFISHDLKVIKALADYIVVLKNGRIVEQGSAADLFTSPQHAYTQTLFKAALHGTPKRDAGLSKKPAFRDGVSIPVQ